MDEALNSFAIEATCGSLKGCRQPPRPGGLGARRLDQPLSATAALGVATPMPVQVLARSAKFSANWLCQARAVSVTARCAAIRSSTARRR
jgi:hypothetical protein